MYTYVGTRDFIKYHIKSLRQALEVAVNDDYLEVVQLGLKEGEELGELMASGKGLKLGGAAQASGGGAFLKKGMSLPSRQLGGGAQGSGLPRGSLKASAVKDKEDNGFDADDWFKDFEIDSEDVNDAQSFSQSAAKQASSPSLLQSKQDNNEDEIIDILDKAPPRTVQQQQMQQQQQQQQQPQFGSLEKSAAKIETLGASESPSSDHEEEQQKLPEESAAAREEMECEVSTEEKVEEEENAMVDVINGKAAVTTEATVDDAQDKRVSSDEDLSSLFEEEDGNKEEDEAIIEATSEKTAAAAATPSHAAPSAEREEATPLPASKSSPPKELSSFQFPALNNSTRLPNNNKNKPRVPSRLGPGRSPPLPAAAPAPPTAPVHAAKAAMKNINESFSPLFPSATTKSPELSSALLAGKEQLDTADANNGGGGGGGGGTGTPTPITPAGESQEPSAAAITPGTGSPFHSSTTVEKAASTSAKAKAAATPQTAAAASPAAPRPSAPAPAAAATAPGINDALLKIDFSARGDEFLSSLEEEEAATQEALATPTAKKVFSLSTSAATAGVETESLSRKLEELDVNLTMTRLKYALDTVEAAVMGSVLLGSKVGKEHSSGGGGNCGFGDGSAAAAAAACGVVTDGEAMEIDIMN